MSDKNLDKSTARQLPIYLLVVDNSAEFKIALQYGSYVARKNNARIGLLHIMDKEDFQHWGSVQSQMHEEVLREAENLLLGAADIAREITGRLPVLFLQQNGHIDSVMDVVKEGLYIEKLILGASTQSSSPGPMVSYFTGKGLGLLPVPLTIVPDNLNPDLFRIDT